jgi:hypothetical protein
MGGWLCALSVPLCLCGCPGERSSIPVDHQMVEGAAEDWAEAFVEDSFDLAQPVAPRRVEYDQVAAAQLLDLRQEIVDVHVAECCGSLPVHGTKKGAFDEQNLRRQNLRSGCEDPGAAVGAVGQEIGRELFGDSFSGVAAASDLLAGEICERGQQMMTPPHQPRAQGGHPVVGGEERQLHVSA